MDFDENKKLEVEISENEIAINEVNAKKRKKNSIKSAGIDLLDLVIIPVSIGVFISLGFLFANLAKITAVSTAVSGLSSLISSIF